MPKPSAGSSDPDPYASPSRPHLNAAHSTQCSANPGNTNPQTSPHSLPASEYVLPLLRAGPRSTGKPGVVRKQTHRQCTNLSALDSLGDANDPHGSAETAASMKESDASASSSLSFERTFRMRGWGVRGRGRAGTRFLSSHFLCVHSTCDALACLAPSEGYSYPHPPRFFFLFVRSPSLYSRPHSCSVTMRMSTASSFASFPESQGTARAGYDAARVRVRVWVRMRPCLFPGGGFTIRS
ncbi:hypothetical protein C8F04DRAFT_568386 [Mycena alexandri]|uniref:Uncharacterized protein n=1 Tax=Mycena alexandri TaxID=1745969 RepID=A0AAD6X744_9AGAR|nr:hypothetical protein C8F04DRAFT_568386 [Mycena alexandri]